jgi:hypothetical protein
VVQWDIGKLEQDGHFIHISSLNRPPNALLSAVNWLKSDYEMSGLKINEFLNDVERKFKQLDLRYTRRECLEDLLLVSKRVG